MAIEKPVLFTAGRSSAWQWNSLGSWNGGQAQGCDVTELMKSAVLWEKEEENRAGKGKEVVGACRALESHEGQRQLMGRPLTSLGPQLSRTALLAAVLLLLWVKGVTPQKGGPGSEERSQDRGTPPPGKEKIGRTVWSSGPDLSGAYPSLLTGPE